MMSPETSFGLWVKRRRKALDLTQQDLAKQVGCSVSLIFKIESDERRPSRQVAGLLAQYLEIPPEQHVQFMKVARQEKRINGLDLIPPLSGPEVVSASQRRQSKLPVPPTPLIGRENEISAVVHQLSDPSCRMLTLTGPGGVGKTRLAIEVARQFETNFSDGVFFLSLAGVILEESIIPTIADVLRVVFSGPVDPRLQVLNYLRNKEMLLVFDNFEHLLAGGGLLGEILQQAPKVTLLLTSREPVHLQWEWVFELQGLPVPEETSSTDALAANSAVSLFLQRARQVSRDFSLDAENAPACARICHLVDGLPLAIELAASWVRIMSPGEIALELERSIDWLETTLLDVPDRHRSIKTVFEHSWKLLTDEERAVLMKLSVFQGGFTRHAAQVVADASLFLLSSLVNKSLLRHSKSPNRYDLHELIRQYTFALLYSDQAAESQTYEKYAEYYTDWIAALEGPFKSAQQPQTSQQIRAETGNWQSCWHWAVKNRRLGLLRKMIPCLNWYLEVHGYYDEALSIFKTAVDRFRLHGASPSIQSAEERSTFAFLVDSLGWFEFRTGNVERGTTLLAESLELAREDNDPEVLYYIYGNWGYLALLTGDISEANRLTTESLSCADALNSPWHRAIPISVLGIVAYQQEKFNEAYQQLTESLEIWRSVGDPRGLVFCMLYLGMTTLALGDIPATRIIVQESNQIAEANMDRWAHAFGLDMLGMVSLSQDQSEAALAYFSQSLTLSNEIGDQMFGTQTIVHMGQAHAALQYNEEAKRLFREAYATAQQAKWTPIILNALVSFTELQNRIPDETKLGVATAVLSHPSITPHLRARCERIRGELSSSLTAAQIKVAESQAIEKSLEAWAQEILNSADHKS
jgi:predicted ATPase/transcriptional regulator with XRE-family HTH domain